MLTTTDLENIDNLVKKRLGPVTKAVKKIQKDIKTIVNYFDKEYLGHNKRIKTIERHLGIQSL